jgi:integrase
MTRRRNPFPGVTRAVDRHGTVRWRIRWNGKSGYLHGPYGSAEWRIEYEAFIAGAERSQHSNADRGTIAWLIEQYLGSLRFQNLSESRKRTIRLELDWLRKEAGQYHFARIEVRHVEALMAKKDGPTAANTVKKNLSMLFNFASKKLGYTGPNPARFAERMKVNPDGFHTRSEAEVDRFLGRHGPGTKARLVLLLALNTGMSRQDLARAGWQHVKNGRIAYRRGKTSVAADLPILPELAEELRQVSTDRLLFITQENSDRPYTVPSLGNWFRDRCIEAGVPGRLHGLRKAGAVRLADAGATDWEVASYLAHTDTKQASTYTKKANRSRLADSGFAKMTGGNVSNLSARLDKGES